MNFMDLSFIRDLIHKGLELDAQDFYGSSLLHILFQVFDRSKAFCQVITDIVLSKG